VLAFPPDGKLLAAGDMANEIKLWDVSMAAEAKAEK
jgi:hypothetical protein